MGSERMPHTFTTNIFVKYHNSNKTKQKHLKNALLLENTIGKRIIHFLGESESCRM